MFGPCGGLSRSAAIEEPFNRTTKNKLLLTTKTNYELMQTFYILRIPISFCTINTNFLFSSSPDPFSHVNKKKLREKKKVTHCATMATTSSGSSTACLLNFSSTSSKLKKKIKFLKKNKKTGVYW